MNSATICRVVRRALAASAVVGYATLLIASPGCSRPYGVPYWNTNLVGEAPRGQTNSFQAPDEGTVWVNGGRAGQPRHIVYSGLIDRGEVIVVDTGTRKILLDGKPVDATITEPNPGYYQIWYQPIRQDLLAP